MKPEINLINPMTNIGGSELRTIDLYHLLTPFARVRIWTDRTPHPELTKLAPIRRIRLRLVDFPRKGLFVFVGAYFEPGRWWRLARPARTILVYNILNRRRLHHMLDRLRLGGQRQIEILYASETLRRDAGLPGMVEDSPIDLQRFRPRARTTNRASNSPFVVGRASRDELLKFSAQDPALYTQLAESDVDVRIVGGTCLADRVKPHPRIRLLPTVSPAFLPEFMRDIDCFHYRTAAELIEAYGRVIAEAMACGVPPVVGSSAGIARLIENGVNGFVADSNRDTVQIIARLRADAALRSRIGQAARHTIERRYDETRLAAMTAYYLDPLFAAAAIAANETSPEALKRPPRHDVDQRVPLRSL